MSGSSLPQRVRVRAPATSANLGPGFDSIGLALNLYGEVELERVDEPVPAVGPGEEMALNAARQTFRHLGRPSLHVAVRLLGDVPIGRGLGASAIVQAGAALAAAALSGVDLDRERLVALVAELEGHADNAAPAVLGGLQVVVWDDGEIWHVQVPLPTGLRAVLFVPDFEMPTHLGRRLLPESLSRRDAVHNIGRAALLVAGLATGRLDVLRTATQDLLHQPARSQLFPAMYDLFDAALGAGALCAYLSGAGSSILCLTQQDGDRVAAALEAAAVAAGVGGRILRTEPSEHGAEIVARL